MTLPSEEPPPLPEGVLVGALPAPLWVRYLAGAADTIVAGMLALALILTILIPVYFPDTQSILFEYADYSEGNLLTDTDLASKIKENPRLRNMLLASQMILYSVFFFYFLISEWVTGGSSLGKKIFRITAVHRQLDRPMSLAIMLMRAWMKTVFLLMLMPLLWTTFLWAFFQAEKRMVHDLLTGTWVID